MAELESAIFRTADDPAALAAFDGGLLGVAPPAAAASERKRRPPSDQS